MISGRSPIVQPVYFSPASISSCRIASVSAPSSRFSSARLRPMSSCRPSSSTHAEVHVQVRRRRVRPEGVERHVEVELAADIARERRGERHVRGRHGRDEALGELVERAELVAQPLRHRLGERLHLLLQQARHQPLGARRRHLVEQRERHRHGHAVARRARLEVVLERDSGSGRAASAGGKFSVVMPAASWRIRSSRARCSSFGLAASACRRQCSKSARS